MMIVIIILIITIIIYTTSVLPQGFSELLVALARSVLVSHEAGNRVKKRDHTRTTTGHDLG